ncbi:MAG TPA: GxxExxY protein [Desulfobacteria bacterium]|nr:GxxExxY protein [Desulfobacteria bacterium]
MKRNFSDLSHRVIGAAIEVHRYLGPGLLESTYQQCLARELHLAGISFKPEYPLPVDYKGIHLDCGYRIDLLIENTIIVELKSVAQLKPIHDAQLLTYMKLAKIEQGFLMNFNLHFARLERSFPNYVEFRF